MNRIPLTPNGKKDKKALPDPEYSIESSNTYTPPVTHLEKELVRIWEEVLEIKTIGIHDDFFELGGHSLLATQVITKIRNELNHELPLKALFENSTIDKLAKSNELKQTEYKTESIEKIENTILSNMDDETEEFEI